MSKAKYTPGPWKSVRDKEHNEILIVARPRRQFIASLDMKSARADVGENCANARLIAVAPTLLEGLTQAVDQLERDYVVTPLDGRGALIRKLRAVIAQAGGPSE